MLDNDVIASSHDLVRMLCVGFTIALAWGRICWWRGWPTSNGQSLLAGLVGAALAMWGPAHVPGSDWPELVFLRAYHQPVAQIFLRSDVPAVLRWAGERLSARARPIADGCHVLSCLRRRRRAPGSNEGQLAVGVLIPLVGLLGVRPMSIRFFIALALSLGILVGRQRMLKKLKF